MNLDRRRFLRISGATALGTTVGPLAGRLWRDKKARRSGRPNILVFLTDDHGQWAQHAYGNTELRTPNFDGLAARGTRMTQAFTPCPVCSPARASFFTGRMPSQHGIHDWLEEKSYALTHPGLTGQTLISELMKGAGYHTGLVGKWHCGRTREPHPGFDYWFSYWVWQYPHRGAQQFSEQGRLVEEAGQQSPLLTRRAIEFLRDHRRNPGTKERPFFLFVSYVDTHSPHRNAPAGLVDDYAPASFRDIPREKFAPCHVHALTPVRPDPALERHMRMEYYGAVASVDREVGKILAELEAAGQFDDTLVVYSSDHGLNCGQHGIWEKGNATIPQNFLEESIRVSCTLSWPAGGVRPNAACDSLVTHCDLWATLLDAAGAAPDEAAAAKINSPGRSYLRQLRGARAPDWREVVVSEYGNARMARTRRFKLINRYPYAGVTFPDELYDLKNDPRETVNVHDDPRFQEVVRALSAELGRFFGRFTVPGHSGLQLQDQPECTTQSPWLLATSPRWNKLTDFD